MQVDDIVQFYCSTYRYTKACTYVQKLEQQGFQPGSLLSGNMRNRVLNNLTAGDLGGITSFRCRRWAI